MKQHYFKQGLALILLTSVTAMLNAQTLKKDFHKEYQAGASTELTIENQFGTITVQEWDQNKIVIDVNVEVTADKQDISQKLLDLIDVKFKEEGNKILAHTDMESKGSIDGKNTKFNINYTVKCPKDLNLKIDHQFGDVSLGSLTGPVEVSLQFGSLSAVSLTGTETTIEVQFGKATINELKNASVEVQHCEMVKISTCSKLDLEAQFSEVSIGTVDDFDGELNNGQCIIEKLGGSLTAESNMGSLTVKDVAATFSSIEIEQNMGEVELSIDPKAGYKLSAEAEMGDIKVPSGFKADKQQEEHIPGLKSSKVNGTYGDGKSSIEVNVNMGSIKIK
jgi:hypothetical protein